VNIFSVNQVMIGHATLIKPGIPGLRTERYVVINRHGVERAGFVMYVAMVASEQEALAAVKAEFNPLGELEINGLPLQDSTVSALALRPGEVRRAFNIGH
jgi:hypothetical protein